MPHPHQNDTLLNEVVNHISTNGTDGLLECVRLLFNHAMKAERSEALEAAPYERTDSRKGYANGFKKKTLQTRLGELKVDVPQVRGGVDFYPSALERGLAGDFEDDPSLNREGYREIAELLRELSIGAGR